MTNGHVAQVATSAIGGLKPAQYLALVLFNVMVLGGLFYYLDRREESRDLKVLPIITACLARLPP